MKSSSCTTMLQSKYGITILSYYNITTKSITLHETTREVKAIGVLDWREMAFSGILEQQQTRQLFKSK